MKILFVLENYAPHIGGVEIVFKNLCEGLAKKHEVTVVTHHIPGTKKQETHGGVKIVRVPCFDSRYVFSFAAIPIVLKLAHNVDIIHANRPNGVLPAWFARVFRNKPTVATVHEVWIGRWEQLSDFGSLRAALHDFLEWCSTALPFDKYICVSNSTKKELKKVFPNKPAVTIHNFVIFAGGRPGTTKGFEYLLKAWKQIKKQIPKSKLVLMLSKDSQYAHKVEEFKKKYKEVIFVDPKPYKELPAWRQMADCVVVPSTSEGFGYVVLESVAAGTPVVASNTASIPEVIWGKHVLVRPKSPKAIVEGILKVHQGKYMSTKEKKFTWTKNISAHEKLYEELL